PEFWSACLSCAHSCNCSGCIDRRLPGEIFLIDGVNTFTPVPVIAFPRFVIFAAHSNRQFSLFGRFSRQRWNTFILPAAQRRFAAPQKFVGPSQSTSIGGRNRAGQFLNGAIG